ncbi:MFS transporter [bacterium]|nr:MFS transporter [bacterium]
MKNQSAPDMAAYRSYGSRWLVLGLHMLANLTIQMLWISYAPVTASAGAFSGVSELQIGLFSMIFMIAFIPLSIPVSWCIDRFGSKATVAAGAIITGICGIARGMAGPNFGLAIAATIGMAAAQPAFLNSWTKVAASWFPSGERATAVGMMTLANLLGAAIGQVATPMLAETMTISQVQLYYGTAAAAAALLFVLFAREKPATPPDASAEGERALMLDGLKRALSLKSFRRYLLMAFIGLGIFNGVTTWIEGIVRPRGFDSMQAGVAIAAMLTAGIVGAVAIPALSDRRGRRKPYIILGLLGGIPGIVGLALAPSYPLLIASSIMLGFFLVSVNPIGTQYASETALPTPEGTSNGLISLAGQLSVVLVYAMEPLQRATGSYVAPLLCFAALLGAGAALAATLVEAPAGKR